VRHYTREELLDLAAGYAVGGLNAEETAAVRQALATEPELAAEVNAYLETMTALAKGETLAPSPEVRERLLAAVRADGQHGVAADEGEGAHAARSNGAAPAAPAAPATPATPPLVVRRALPPFRRSLLGTGVGAPVAASLLAASLLVAAGLARQNAALRDAVRDADSSGEAARTKLDHREHTLNTLFHAEKDLYVVHLKAADTVRGPGVQIFWNERHRAGVLHAFRLPPAPAGRSYQLWTLVDGAPVSAKVFDSDPDGHALVENLALPATVRGVSEMVITLEPAGGSPRPTGVAVMRGVMRGG
jgi:anti-sigma-K factor RskA